MASKAAILIRGSRVDGAVLLESGLELFKVLNFNLMIGPIKVRKVNFLPSSTNTTSTPSSNNILLIRIPSSPSTTHTEALARIPFCPHLAPLIEALIRVPSFPHQAPLIEAPT
jgi:hypothetical protein